MKKLLFMPGVNAVKADQCMYGLTTLDDTGCETPVKKPTRFVSNSPLMLEELSRKCDHTHPHWPLLGGRAQKAASYALPLIFAILRGMHKTIQARDIMNATLEEEYDHTLPRVISDADYAADANTDTG